MELSSDEDFYFVKDEESTDVLAAMDEGVQEGDVKILKAIKASEQDAFLRCLRKNGSRLLLRAIRYGKYDIADFLLCNGTSTDCCAFETTPLHLAVQDANARTFIERLLVYQPEVDIRCPVNNNTPLHLACESGLEANARILLQKKANYNAVNIFNQTPLQMAVCGGHVFCVKLLLEFGADVAHLRDFADPDHFLISPVDFAASSFFNLLGHTMVSKCTEVFVDWSCPKAEEVLAHLLSQGFEDDPSTPHGVDRLNECKRRLEIIDLLVEKGAKFSILLLAAKVLLTNNFFQVLKYLVEEKGMDINGKDQQHYTPLHIAVERFPFEIIKYMIDHGADVCAVSLDRLTPLQIAVYNNVSIDVIKLLVNHGALVNVSYQCRMNPLTLSLKLQNIPVAQFLIESGADINMREALMPGFTPLMYILKDNPYNTKAMKFLLEHGADVHMKDGTHLCTTALHMAANYRTEESQAALIMELFLEYTTNVNVLDSHNYTPLMRSILVPISNLKIIRLLLEKGADPQVVGLDGSTALNLIIRNSKANVLSLLLEFELEFNVNELFSDRNILVGALTMNMPYERAELNLLKRFSCQDDLMSERRSFVKKFVRDRLPYKYQDAFERMVNALCELLRGSPAERWCFSSCASPCGVLFMEAENVVLKSRASKQINENQLRAVLEYRLEVLEGDNYKDACSRELKALESHVVFESTTLANLFALEPDELTSFMRRDDIYKIIIHNYESVFSDELRYPIFGNVLKKHFQDALAKRNLVLEAAHSLNFFFSMRFNPQEEQNNAHTNFTSLPSHISDKILGCLSNKDLQNLIISQSDFTSKSVRELKDKWKMKLVDIIRWNDVCLLGC